MTDEQPPKVNRALVLSGGGAKGIYEVGCLQALLEEKPGLDFDFFVGISAGSLNASFLSQASMEDGFGSAASRAALRRRVADLLSIWQTIHEPADIYKGKSRPGPLTKIWVAAGKNGLVDPRPIRAKIRDHVGPSPVQRRLHVGATCLEDGFYRGFEFWKGRPAQVPGLATAVMASAAVPAVFDPIEIEGATLVDGAIRENTPLGIAYRAFDEPLPLPAAGELPRVVVIQTSPLLGYVPPQPFAMGGEWDGDNALDVLIRAAEIMADEVQKDDVRGARGWNLVLRFLQELEESRASLPPAIAARLDELHDDLREPNKPQKRYVSTAVYAPDEKLLDNELVFTEQDLKDMLDRGRTDAQHPRWVV